MIKALDKEIMAIKLAIFKIKLSSMLKDEAELQRAHLQSKLAELLNERKAWEDREM